jgi:hypothetical protein
MSKLYLRETTLFLQGCTIFTDFVIAHNLKSIPKLQIRQQDKRFDDEKVVLALSILYSLHHRIKISNRRATRRCNVSANFLCKNMQFTGQKAEQPASTACLLARKCH